MAGDYLGYDGPYPPFNDERLHHYFFRVFALDVASLQLPARFTAADAYRAMHGHVLAEAALHGTYTLEPGAGLSAHWVVPAAGRLLQETAGQHREDRWPAAGSTFHSACGDAGSNTAVSPARCAPSACHARPAHRCRPPPCISIRALRCVVIFGSMHSAVVCTPLLRNKWLPCSWYWLLAWLHRFNSLMKPDWKRSV
jgi:hypothetical protein